MAMHFFFSFLSRRRREGVEGDLLAHTHMMPHLLPPPSSGTTCRISGGFIPPRSLLRGGEGGCFSCTRPMGEEMGAPKKIQVGEGKRLPLPSYYIVRRDGVKLISMAMDGWRAAR